MLVIDEMKNGVLWQRCEQSGAPASQKGKKDEYPAVYIEGVYYQVSSLSLDPHPHGASTALCGGHHLGRIRSVSKPTWHPE